MTHGPDPITFHASTVSIRGQGVVIEGASGAGKSGLSLTLMAMGARLVADDRTILTRRGDQVIASPPAAIAGRIEARGIGILCADHEPEAPVALVVNLSEMETDRLPPRRSKNLLGIRIPMLHYVESPYFAAGILQYLIGSRDA